MANAAEKTFDREVKSKKYAEKPLYSKSAATAKNCSKQANY